MHILTIGLNHRTAPIELREQLAFSEDRLKMATSHLRNMKSILEGVIVSTCNRMELYVVCDQLHTGEYYTKAFLESWFDLPREEFQTYLYVKKNEHAVQHLFRVVAGLDSLIIGETQILGQIKTAFFTAREVEATGTIFNKLFQQAITFGKQVHRETEIGSNPVSIGYAAVEKARQLFDRLDDRSVVLLGAGKMAELTAKHFDSYQTKMVVLNRTYARAKQIADRFHGKAYPWDQLHEVLQEADIVISSTSSQEYIVTADQMEPIVCNRTTPLFFIDIALPRDIDPAVRELDQVFLYNLDDLEGIVDYNKAFRAQVAERVNAWIEKEVTKFYEWVQMLGVVPIIGALREKALSVQEEVMQRIERKLPDLTEKEKRVIRKQTKSIINQLLRDPIVRIKELSTSPNQEEIFELCKYIFALEEYVDQRPSAKEKVSSLSTVRKKLYSSS